MKEKIVYGVRAVVEAIETGKSVDKILLKTKIKSENKRQILSLAKQMQIPVQFVPSEKLDKITKSNHQGVIAFISPIEYYRTEDIVQKLYEDGKVPLLLILDGVTDVRNFGAIARTAECAGVHAIVIKDKGSVRITQDAIKTSAGALFNIPVCRTSSLANTIKYLKNSGLNIVAASEKGSVYHFEHDFTVPVAIIMGSEGFGISNDLLKLSDKVIKIPILGKIESLNVANAASVIIYEAVRQRLITK